MQKLEEFGHIIVYGQTNSGKTTFAKYILYYFAKKNLINKIYIFRPERLMGEDWDPPKFPNLSLRRLIDENLLEVETLSNFDENIKRIRDAPGNKLVVFDDYNNEINTSSNKDYKSLFTDGRKDKIRVINLVHSYTAITPIAKKNCQYCVIMAMTSDKEEIKNLASTYFNNNWILLFKYLNEVRMQDKHNAIIIDKPGPELVHFKVPFIRDASRMQRVDESSSQTRPKIEEIEEIDRQNTYDVSIPVDVSNSSWNNDIPIYSDVGNPLFGDASPRMQNSLSIGQKNAQFLQDRSINNFNTKFRADVNQLQETQYVQHIQKIKQLEYKYEEEKEERIYNCKKFLQKSILLPSEKEYLIESFNYLFKWRKNIDWSTFDKGQRVFILKYMPELVGTTKCPSFSSTSRRIDGKRRRDVDNRKNSRSNFDASKLEEKTISGLITAAKIYNSNNWEDKLREGYSAIKYITN